MSLSEMNFDGTLIFVLKLSIGEIGAAGDKWSPHEVVPSVMEQAPQKVHLVVLAALGIPEVSAWTQ